MKLGDVAQITLGVADIAASHEFFQQLGFQTLDESREPWPWAQLTDGENLVLLSQDGHEYTGLTYFSSDAAERAARLEANGTTFVLKQEENGRFFQAVFDTGQGLMVALINYDASQMAKPTGQPLSLCGKFGELAIPVADFAKTADYWGRLGFSKTYGSPTPYPWGIFNDEMMVLGIHQTDDFKQPTLTYFTADAAERIAKLKAKGVALAQEMTDDAGNVTGCELHAPSGQAIFIFNGDM